MKRTPLSLCMVVNLTVASFAQSFVDTFDENVLGWTECYVHDNGSSIIDKGVLTLVSKGENKVAGSLISFLTGVSTTVGENTIFETHCYAPIDVKKPFEVIANVRIDKLSKDRICGFILNYRDNGNFYCFNFNNETVNFSRFENGYLVGNIMQGITWPTNKKINHEWKLICDGDEIRFIVNGVDIFKVKHMPVDYSGIGFCSFGKQTLVIEDITFTQI